MVAIKISKYISDPKVTLSEINTMLYSHNSAKMCKLLTLAILAVLQQGGGKTLNHTGDHVREHIKISKVLR